MNWTDYRQALGIGFADKDKVTMLANRFSVLLDILRDSRLQNEETICRKYFIDVCEVPGYYYAFTEVKKSIITDEDLLVLLSKAVALRNAFWINEQQKTCCYVEQYILQALEAIGLPYEIKEDSDGIFIFPKGAKELDEANVSIPFQWLMDYPKSRKAMELALKSYSKKHDPSDTADLFRKALETFAQELLGSEKSLENLKSEFGLFMKSKGVPKELRSNIETVLQMYTNYINDYAKHRDGTAEIFLEFIMYHTGNIIRFMISLKGQDNVSQVPTD